MNFYLVQLLGKWMCFLAVSVFSLLGISLNEKTYVVIDNNDRNVSVVTEIIEYDTIKKYDSSLPSNIKNVLQEGTDGLVFKNTDNEEITLEEVVNEEIQIGTGDYGFYNGVITGYGPDCYTCSGEGYVACRTREKKNFNLLSDGIYYNDTEYGKVRVLAAALSKFPCGTIVKVNSRTLGEFTGIVLDTGYDMRKHLEMGIYHFDVAYMTEKEEMVAKTTDMSGKVEYSVQRWGW